MIEGTINSHFLDLRGTPCPINFIKCRLAIENLQESNILQVNIDRGEPEIMVIKGLKSLGHNVEVISESKSFLTLNISRAKI